MMTPPETTPGAAHLRSPEGSDDRFLVEEENRRIGWSCHTKKQFPAQVSSEDQLHDELEAASSTEIRPLNCVDKGKDVKHCMQMDTNPASEGQSEGEAEKGKQFTACAGSQWGGENVTSPVTAGIARPCSFSHLGQKLPFKKRRPYSHTETEVEMEREKVEDVYLEVKVEDAVMEAKEKCMPVEIEKENHFAEVKEDEPVKAEAEDAVADKKEESLEEGEIREETAEETEKISELELVNEGLYVPHLTIDENQQDIKNEELNLEETAGEPNEKPRRGRKTPRSSASTSSDEPHQGRQKLKRGSPKRMQDPAEENQGCVEKRKPLRGRPNRGKEESPLSNNRYPRRGRSQRDTEESFPSNNRKPRRGRPKRSTEESPHSNNTYPRRGRSKRDTEESFPSNSRKPRRGRPKRSAEESPHSNSGYSLDTEESSPSNNRKPRRGRPKRSTGKSPHSNNRNAEMPKPKRGRPKRVKE
ncbi:uncharacterized protein [Malus domestica]|uniref:uncharacterized protein isoform X2 n=1 Tax=Malus domestica TaxID=3750 RepID=UPI0039762C27